MRIAGLSIDGFGIFSSYETRAFSGGLNVLYGPNEAGKSTLLAFLRGVLFGFPRPTKSRRSFYPPLAGGRQGGRVFVETQAGLITIERETHRSSRLWLDDGSGTLTQLSDPEFQQMIGGIDAQTFRSVFAFSLDELSDFASLTGEQVRARIFAAGVGGGGPSAQEAIRLLERERAQLLKPRSADTEISRILDALSACEQKLREARSLMESYPELLKKKDMVREQLWQLETQERDLRLSQGACQNLLEMWPVWVDIQSAREELGSLEQVDEFPPQATQQFTAAKEGLESARRGLDRLLEKRRVLAERLVRLREAMDDKLFALAPQIQRQAELLTVYEDRQREQNNVAIRLARVEDHLQRMLCDLGLPGGEEALASTDTSLTRGEEIRRWRAALDEATAHTRQAAEQLALATKQREALLRECEREREVLAAMPGVDEARMISCREALRTLRPALAERRALQGALEGHLAAADALAAAAGQMPTRQQRRWREIAAAVLAAVWVVFALVAWEYGRPGTVLILGILAAVTIIILAGLLMFKRDVTKHNAVQSLSTTAALDQQRKEQAEIRRRLAELDTTLSGPAAILGIVDLNNVAILEDWEAKLAHDEELVVAHKQQIAAVAAVERRLARATEEYSRSQLCVKTAEKEQQILERRFAAALASWGLPAALSPEGAEDYLRGLAAAKEVAARRDEERERLRRLEREQLEWEDASVRLVEAAGRPFCGRPAVPSSPPSAPAAGRDDNSRAERSLSGEAATAALLEVAKACQAEIELRRRAEELDKAKCELDAEIEQGQAELAVKTQAWQTLLAQTGAKDEQDFLYRQSIYERRQQLKHSLQAAESLLTKRIGTGEEARAFRSQLVGGEVPRWRETVEQAQSELEEVRTKRDALLKAEGDIERQLRELEESADVSALETAYEGLCAELEVAVEHWRIMSLAILLMKETLARFTLERQPFVLSEASRMFAQVTQERYTQVRRSPTEEGIVVMESSGRVKPVEELSRGTAEQLYLCLRLALAKEFARRAEPIPLIMDDVLVNFDGDRRRTTAQLLLEFSKQHQILFFTCHAEIADLIVSLSSQTPLIRVGSDS